MQDMGMVLIAVVVGVALGALMARLIFTARARTREARDESAHEQLRASEAVARADAERARADVASLREQLADAQADAAEARAGTHEAKAEAALARQQTAEVRAQESDGRSKISEAESREARLEARLTAALVERDAAVARSAELAADREQVTKDFELLSNRALEEQGKRADQTAEQRLKATELLMTPIRESLAQFNSRLVEVEKSRVEMSASLAAQVKAVLDTGELLRRETHALSTALRKPQVRGAWGETQLKNVAEHAGMLEHCDFLQQATSITSEDRIIRPDMRVSLAEGKFVYVDSKVPLNAYLDAQETENERDRDQHLGRFAKNVRGHVDALGGKNYWKAGDGTPEFVVMFIPSEALGLEALRLVPDLHEYANGRNVVVATPTTLIAMLRAIGYGWKQARLAESAAEVSQLGRELYDRLGNLGGHFDKLGRALGSTVKAYNATLGSLESRVMVTARRFRDLGVADSELVALVAGGELPRNVTAPELLESVESTPGEAAPLPELDELIREYPPLDELVQSTTVTPLSGRGRMSG